jgi:hypothetical protein
LIDEVIQYYGANVEMMLKTGTVHSWCTDRRNKALNVAEAELASREHRLNSQLARANENLQRALVVALEADRACTQVSWQLESRGKTTSNHGQLFADGSFLGRDFAFINEITCHPSAFLV